MENYINISKASSSSLVERVGASTTLNSFVAINKVAEAKGLKSTRFLRIEINKPESKYISRPIQVNGGTSYEILFESLEPDIQERIFGRAESSKASEPVRCGQNDEFCHTPNNPREKIRENETKSTALVPLNYQPPAVTFTSESARLTSLATKMMM